MASGGGTPPSHLSLPQLSLSSNYSSSSEALQTPQLSLTPVTNFTVGGSDGSATRSFTSLEELLNITGINSPGSRLSGEIDDDNGVGSLHKMAQAVESSIQGSSIYSPAPKKPRLDFPRNASELSNTGSLSLPPNIRVQSLNTNATSATGQPAISIASLLHKTQFKGVSSAATTIPVQPTQHADKVVNSLTKVTPPTSFASSGTNVKNIASFNNSDLIQAMSSKQFTWPQPHTQESSQLSTSLPQNNPTLVSIAQTIAGLQSSVAPTVSSLMQSPTSAPSTVNPRAFLLQLIQLYKHYQALGDNEGMTRVKKQLNVLVSTHQGPSVTQGSNPLLGSLSLLTNPPSTIATCSNSNSTQSNTLVSGSQTTPGSTVSLASSGTATVNTRLLNSLPNLIQAAQQMTSTHARQNISATQVTQPSVPVHSLLNSSKQTDLRQQQAISKPLPNPQLQLASLQRSLQFQRQPTDTSVKTNGFSFPLLTTSGGVTSVGSTGLQSVFTSADASSVSTSGSSSLQTVDSSAGGIQQNQAVAVHQKAVKQLQSIMASLPVSKRPKTVHEIREFVQKYSNLISQIQTGNLPDLSTLTSVQSNKTQSTSSSAIAAPSTLSISSADTLFTQSTSASMARPAGTTVAGALHPIVVPLNFRAQSASSSTQTAGTASTSGVDVTAPRSTLSSSALAQVDQHFQNSLSALKKTIPAVPLTQPLPAKPVVVDLTQEHGELSVKGLRLPPPLAGDLSQPSAGLSTTIHAPMTTQFTGTVTATKPLQHLTVVSSQGLTTSANVHSGIQAGVATPLPPGLTLETLAVLCRLPESELSKLKLPAGLLSAIKVWKDRQPAKKGVSNSLKMNLNSNAGNIPVLFPPSAMSSSPSNLSNILPISKASMSQLNDSITHHKSPMKVGDAVSFASSQHTHELNNASVRLPGGADNQLLKMPYVIPSSVGFPPRSLHAYIPGVGQTYITTPTNKPNVISGNLHEHNVGRRGSQHMTRYKLKVEQERAQKDRLQAITKALQSSEEARIAFRFSAHLDKMHSQLLSPETTTPFSSKQDMLARLLPYHVFAESEPPHAAVEKADAVFESVAQVLLSRSKGLQSRFQQMLANSDVEGGSEIMLMEMELRKCFMEGEQERIQQEQLEKKQAEQVAADLSMMVKADGEDTFDSEFSLSDAFFPFLDIDNGIT